MKPGKKTMRIASQLPAFVDLSLEGAGRACQRYSYFSVTTPWSIIDHLRSFRLHVLPLYEIGPTHLPQILMITIRPRREPMMSPSLRTNLTIPINACTEMK